MSFITNVPGEVRIAAIDVYPALVLRFFPSSFSYYKCMSPLIARVMALGTGKLRKGGQGLCLSKKLAINEFLGTAGRVCESQKGGGGGEKTGTSCCRQNGSSRNTPDYD